MSLQGAVIAFDLDGTLVDTAPDLIGSMNVLMAEEGLEPFTLENGKKLIGAGVNAAVQRALAQRGVELDGQPLADMVGRFTTIYRSRIAEESRVYEGAREVLDRLAEAGARLAVCTNKRTALSLQLLDALDLTSRFAAVIGGDLIAQKPDPRLLHYAIEQAGGAPGRALLVGDSYIDQATARAAGAPVIGVTFGYTDRPLEAADFDALIDRYEKLPPVVERLIGRAP
jgi:phosphoglycolate phosphatase